MEGMDLHQHTRMLARTALLALICTLMYIVGRALPGPFKWLKYFCPTATAILDGGFGYRLRHVIVTTLLIGALFQAGEAVAYFLLIGSFGLCFDWDGPSRSRMVNLIAFFLFFTTCFTGWLFFVPYLLGITSRQMVSLLMLPRYLSVKPLLNAIGVTQRQFETALVEPVLAAVAVLSATFFFMMYVCNSFSLAWVRRALATPPAKESRRAGARHASEQKPSGTGIH